MSCQDSSPINTSFHNLKCTARVGKGCVDKTLDKYLYAWTGSNDNLDDAALCIISKNVNVKCKCNLYFKSVYKLQETRATKALGRLD